MYFMELANKLKARKKEYTSLWHYGEGHDINYAKALAKIRKFADPDIGERFNMQLDESFAAYAKNGYTAD